MFGMLFDLSKFYENEMMYCTGVVHVAPSPPRSHCTMILLNEVVHSIGGRAFVTLALPLGVMCGPPISCCIIQGSAQ